MTQNKNTIFYKFYVQFITCVMLLFCIVFSKNDAKAQPTVLGTSALNNGVFTNYTLNNLGKIRQYRDTAKTSLASNVANWNFPTGTSASPNYSTVWRPYTSLQTIALDVVINPNTTAASARWNTGSGGQDGRLPAITAGKYYTFNIGNNVSSNNYMAVWQTTFNPVAINTPTQSPSSACQGGDSITIKIKTSAIPNALENVFLRYSTDSFTSTSTLLQFSFVADSGTVKIPMFLSGNIVSYYMFSSLLSLAVLAPLGVVNEINCDLSTLNINNYFNANYSYTINNNAVPNVSFTSQNYCSGVATTFTKTSSISSGSIISFEYNFGNLNTSSASTTSVSNIYTSAGSYNPSLTAISNLGCQKTFTQNINITQTPTTVPISTY